MTNSKGEPKDLGSYTNLNLVAIGLNDPFYSRMFIGQVGKHCGTTQFDVTCSMPLFVADDRVNPGIFNSSSLHIAVCYRKCTEHVTSN